MSNKLCARKFQSIVPDVEIDCWKINSNSIAVLRIYSMLFL